MNLEDRLVSLKPREESGSKTARKYQFQKDLSLFILLEQHDKRDDYVYLFDFHDDLIILNSPTNPTSIDFYQIKSKDSGNWTIIALTKGQQTELSILGKLYLNKLIFGESVNTLNFLSNANFSFKNLKDGTDSKKRVEINGIELDNEDVSTCNESIQKEHSLPDNPEFEILTQFQVTKLSNSDSSTHCIGALSKLINIINPENKINPELAYRQVLNETTRLTGNTFSDKIIQNIKDVIDIKGISKAQFLSFLNRAGLYKSVEEEWTEIKTSLEAAGIGYLELNKYHKAWRDVSATLINDRNNIPFQDFVNSVNDLIDSEISNHHISDKMNLIQIINYLYNKINIKGYDEYFTRCLIINIINEK